MSSCSKSIRIILYNKPSEKAPCFLRTVFYVSARGRMRITPRSCFHACSEPYSADSACSGSADSDPAYSAGSADSDCYGFPLLKHSKPHKGNFRILKNPSALLCAFTIVPEKAKNITAINVNSGTICYNSEKATQEVCYGTDK